MDLATYAMLYLKGGFPSLQIKVRDLITLILACISINTGHELILTSEFPVIAFVWPIAEVNVALCYATCTLII